MLNKLTVAAGGFVLAAAGMAIAQTTAGGVVGGSVGATTPAPGAYSPAVAIPVPGTTPSGLGAAMSPGTAVAQSLPQPATGVTPPV